ncbi:VCBS repeat-containing protein [Streptomyces sp. NPDC000349]|uniref:FG-GAP repeat domain-containing protein n=1 Tax=unclassified Streptomyces TaxID=2593676 RepID=UPI00278591D7|nr:VCBS repeat-containing protein [Streptomyces sp. DSM 40167]MDQ0405254.1 hypothetical protein [Streptomyces sp. DSM 40167]
MSHARSSRHRLATAVAAVLAVTAGFTGAAVAAPDALSPGGTARAAGTQAQPAAESVIAFPTGHRIVGATASGYLTLDSATGGHSWVRASDGAVSDLPSSASVLATGYGDLAAVHSDLVHIELRDLATGQEVFRLPLDHAAGVRYAGAAGQAVFSTDSRATEAPGLRMHTRGAASVAVTGLPADASGLSVRPGTSAHALVTYSTGASVRYWGLIDLATGAVTETGRSTRPAGTGDIAVSATYVAWVDGGGGEIPPSVVVRTRATGETQRVPLMTVRTPQIEIGLQGDHLVFGERFGLTADWPSSLHAPVAHDLKRKVDTKLLDHFTSAEASPDGTLYLRGGTVAEGEGLYRFSPGVNGGEPTTTLVARTGEPTKLTLAGHNVPDVVDLSRDSGLFDFRWTLSRNNVEGRVTLRHIRTRETTTVGISDTSSPDFGFVWSGDLGSEPISAPNGDYTWEISARPINGIGPALTETGTFMVVRSAAAPHDFTDNGSPDLLARDASGRMWRSDSYLDRRDGEGKLISGTDVLVGGGWNTYDRTEATGDIGGAATGDLVARDKEGVLWLYLGNGDGTFATRSRVGGGWGVYDKIAAGSDVTNDGKADLLATDKDGTLWLYKGTGDWRAPFAGRIKAGTGYGVYNQITATGDIGGAETGDLIARDTSGVLWLHLGKGDGTFAARTRIGGGWDAYGDTVGIGDANHDGHPDLYAGGTYAEQYFYPGTGDWRAPFAGRQATTFFATQPDPTALS